MFHLSLSNTNQQGFITYLNLPKNADQNSQLSPSVATKLNSHQSFCFLSKSKWNIYLAVNDQHTNYFCNFIILIVVAVNILRVGFDKNKSAISTLSRHPTFVSIYFTDLLFKCTSCSANHPCCRLSI